MIPKFPSLLPVVCLSIAFFGKVHAAPISFQGQDIGPLVQDLQKQVKVLNKSVTVYNWSANGELNEAQLSGMAERLSQSFWSNFGDSTGGGNMYGYGLYAAADPVATYSYGGGPDRFLLIEMVLPKGFQLLDLADYENMSPMKVSDEAKTILKDFKCPSNPNLNQFFSGGGKDLDATCRQLIQNVFQNILKIDGFTYPYYHTSFRACPGSYEQSIAMVITNHKWIRSDSVNYYNPKTQNKILQRIRIQTLFLKAASETKDGLNLNSDILHPLIGFLDAHPDMNLKKSQTKCEGESCVISVEFCDAKNQCQSIALRPLPRPGGPLITSAEAKSTTVTKLLWQDLEGQPKATTYSDWLKANKYACEGGKPF